MKDSEIQKGYITIAAKGFLDYLKEMKMLGKDLDETIEDFEKQFPEKSYGELMKKNRQKTKD